MAKLYFWYGTMNPSKTAQPLTVNHEEPGARVLLLKPNIDRKGEAKVTFKIGLSREVDFLIGDDVFAIISNYIEVSPFPRAILVDEVQFLSSQHIEQLWKIAVWLGVTAMALEQIFRGIFLKALSVFSYYQRRAGCYRRRNKS